MTIYPIDVTASGAVCLGSSVSCDGFRYGIPIRVQTHIHEDHMEGFDESKGFQDIVMSRATHALLSAEFNADLPYRENLHPVEYALSSRFVDAQVTLVHSSHMLGAAQVAVELDSGLRLGYSGDFAWPMTDVIRVDALVVDSTYGSPESVRRFSQADAEDALVSIIRERLRFGAVHLHAHRGTLERALQLLPGRMPHPVVVSPTLNRRLQVFRSFGYVVPDAFVRNSSQALAVSKTESVIHLYSAGDRKPVDYGSASAIVLSAYAVNGAEPFVEYSERSYRVAMTDHADFHGTLAYVAATGAKFVLVDNSRGGHAIELAQEIRSRLGVRAEVSSGAATRSWGD
jgi:putative mRNA 3-end processing factor